MTERKTEGRRCIVVEAEAHPGCQGGLNLGDGNDVVMRGFYCDAAALDCSSHGGSGVPDKRSLDQGWQVGLSSGRFYKFGESWCLLHGGSSTLTDCRLDMKKIDSRLLKREPLKIVSYKEDTGVESKAWKPNQRFRIIFVKTK